MGGIIVVLIIGLIIWYGLHRVSRATGGIVTCGSCNWRGTWRRWKQTGGCPNCGSDICYRDRRKR